MDARKLLSVMLLSAIAVLGPGLSGGCGTDVGGNPLPENPDPNAPAPDPNDPGPAPGDPADPLAGLRPRRLRLIVRPEAGLIDLLWDAPADAAGVASYVVYSAAEPLEEGEAALAVAEVAGDVRQATIAVAPDTGLRHLHVGARAADGEEVLSEALVLDTASRLAFLARKNRTDTIEAFISRLGEPEPLRASGSIVPFSAVVAAFWSPDGRKLAMVSDRERLGTFGLYVNEPDGASEPVKVSGPDGLLGSQIVAAEWSPDCRRIAFSSNQENVNVVRSYVTTPEEGATPRPIDSAFAENVTTFVLKYLRDGRRVLMGVDENADFVIDGVHLVNVEDGSAAEIARAIRTDENFDIFVGLSAGETMFAFLSDRLVPGRNELYVVPVDGSELPRVVSGAIVPGGEVNSALWSPDGTRLAFTVSDEDDRKPELFVIDPFAAGAERVKVSGAPPKNFGVRDFAWSPDGTRLAFLADKEISTNDELYVAPAAGGVEPDKRSGTPIGRGIRGFEWSPDGKRLAFLSEIDSSNFHTLFVTTVEGFVSAKPVNGEIVEGGDVSLVDIGWSSGGALVIFSADKLQKDRLEQFVVRREGGVEPTRVNGGLVSGGQVVFGSAVWSPFSQ